MATSTYKGAYLPTVSGDSGTWGTLLNTTTFPVFDNNLGGIVGKNLTNVNVTLSATESQAAILRLTGTLTGAVQITTACQGFTFIENLTTGAYAVTITNGVGSALTLPQGSRTLAIFDGTNGARLATSNVISLGTSGLLSLTYGSGLATLDVVTSVNNAVLENTNQSVTWNTSNPTVNLNSGCYLQVQLAANVSSLTFINIPAGLCKVTMEITNTGSYNITGWIGSSSWPGGVPPTITSGAGKLDVIVLVTTNLFVNNRGFIVAQNMG